MLMIYMPQAPIGSQSKEAETGVRMLMQCESDVTDGKHRWTGVEYNNQALSTSWHLLEN